MSDDLITLTTEIVAAHVSNNNVAVDDVPSLIQSVYNALQEAGKIVSEGPAESHPPAVSVRASIKPDHIVCLECGAKMKVLKRHLTTDHAMSVTEYRNKWHLPKDYPLVAPNYSQTRKQLAVKIGLGTKNGPQMADFT